MVAKKKDLVVSGSSNYEVTERPDHIKAGKRGSEEIGIDDLTIPRVDLIQDLSPQHKESKPEYIEGAKPGMMFNSVSNKLYGEKVLFVPVFFRKEWIIWGNRKLKHEGFFGAFASEAEAIAALDLRDDAERCEISKTDQQFGLVVDPDSPSDDPTVEEVSFSMAKSKLKISRKMNSIIQMSEDDRFARIYKIGGVEETNANNESYYNLSVRQLGFCSEQLYAMAEVMYEAVSAGKRDVNRAEAGAAKDEDESRY
jgi:hypothetical protein